MKKLMSLFMAGVMILALAVPAFAADPYYEADSESDELTQPITFEARTFVPTVKLSLPKLDSNPVVLNPYKIAYDATAVSGNTLNGVSVDESGDQIKQVISPIYSIKNETDVKLNFAVSATTTLSGEVAISTDPVKVDETNKKAHLSLVVKKTEGAAADIPANDTAQNFGTVASTGAFDTANYEFISLKVGEAKSNNAVTKSLAATSGTANYLLFQFQGDLTRKPTKAWTEDDKVSVLVTFTFTPESKHDFTATAGSTIPATPNAAVDVALSGGLTPATGTTPTYHATAPEWALVSDGGLAGVTVASNKLTISKEGQEALATGANTAKVILSYKDINNVPRTMEVTWTLTKAAAPVTP